MGQLSRLLRAGWRGVARSYTLQVNLLDVPSRHKYGLKCATVLQCYAVKAIAEEHQ